MITKSEQDDTGQHYSAGIGVVKTTAPAFADNQKGFDNDLHQAGY